MDQEIFLGLEYSPISTASSSSSHYASSRNQEDSMLTESHELSIFDGVDDLPEVSSPMFECSVAEID